MRLTRTVRILRIVLLGVLVTTLPGCFMVPLLDGRSPFDSYRNPSYRQIDTYVPVLQELLDEIDSPDWQLRAGRKADNCEGDCDLRFRVTLTPTTEYKLRIVEEKEYFALPDSTPTMYDDVERSYTDATHLDPALMESLIEVTKVLSDARGIRVEIDHFGAGLSVKEHVYWIDGDFYEGIRLVPDFEAALSSIYDIDDDEDVSDTPDERVRLISRGTLSDDVVVVLPD